MERKAVLDPKRTGIDREHPKCCLPLDSRRPPTKRRVMDAWPHTALRTRRATDTHSRSAAPLRASRIPRSIRISARQFLAARADWPRKYQESRPVRVQNNRYEAPDTYRLRL